jgi:hypothetical protein
LLKSARYENRVVDEIAPRQATGLADKPEQPFEPRHRCAGHEQPVGVPDFAIRVDDTAPGVGTHSNRSDTMSSLRDEHALYAARQIGIEPNRARDPI